VGVNCTHPDFVCGLLEKARNVTTKPLLAYPNSGEGWDAVHKCWLESTVSDIETFVELAVQWHTVGCKLIGGCCRTTPKHIEAIARRFV